MQAATTGQAGVREIARGAVRTHVMAAALDLFEADGFDNVTVDQVADAAGISRRTFHRYFAAKEDVIVGDPSVMGHLVRESLVAHAGGSPWVSLRDAFAAMFGQLITDPVRSKRAIRILIETPSLRARNLEKHLHWAELLAPLIEQRLDGTDRHLRAQAIVHAALACLDTALASWANAPANVPLDDVLAQSFSALNDATGGVG